MFWEESFPIVTLFRTDLTRIGLTYEQIEALSNLDMLRLSHRLGKLYHESQFLSHLQQAVNDLLLEKEERSFPIASISRAELQRIGCSDEEIALLTDADLEALAKDMRERYGYRLYDADLIQLAGIMIAGKEEHTHDQK